MRLALVAGNAVLLKPSEVTARSGALVAELFEAAGLPEGVLSVLTGDGETGAALVEAGVDKISFTGSVATGRKVAEACARQLLPCTLELGGKDAMVVCEDADLDAAAGGALAGAFLNTGQYCCGTERVYVVESVASSMKATNGCVIVVVIPGPPLLDPSALSSPSAAPPAPSPVGSDGSGSPRRWQAPRSPQSR